MRNYLPAMISAGGLLILTLGFACLSYAGPRRAGSTYLLSASLCASAQLSAEASRAFVGYSYPVHFFRIGLVLLFAVGFAFMLLAYLARRFSVPRLWPILLAQSIGATIAMLMVPSFDQRTGLVLTSGMVLGMLLAIRAAMRSVAGALPLVAMLAIGLILSVAQPYQFLDRNLYPWTAALFALLLAGEMRRMKIDVASPDPKPTAHSTLLDAPSGLCLGAAASRRFLIPADIVRMAAADDYTEVFLTDGGSVLHPEPLQKLLGRLPGGFLRIHRSHAINLSHLRSFCKGPNSSVLLSDHSIAPVSRRRVPDLLGQLETPQT